MFKMIVRVKRPLNDDHSCSRLLQTVRKSSNKRSKKLTPLGNDERGKEACAKESNQVRCDACFVVRSIAEGERLPNRQRGALAPRTCILLQEPGSQDQLGLAP